MEQKVKEPYAIDIDARMYRIGLTRGQLAKELGVSRQYLSRFLGKGLESIGVPDSGIYKMYVDCDTVLRQHEAKMGVIKATGDNGFIPVGDRIKSKERIKARLERKADKC